MSAARLMLGTISFNSSSHLPSMGKSMRVKPVILPPGRPKLAMKPWATGSLTAAKTIGMELVACFSAATAGELLATITSGADGGQTCFRCQIEQHRAASWAGAMFPRWPEPGCRQEGVSGQGIRGGDWRGGPWLHARQP